MTHLKLILSYALIALFAAACAQNQSAGEQASAGIQYLSPAELAGTETATFAGGCFWCTEAYFERVKGVKEVISGYSGGKEKNPDYRRVSAGQTGHAECVQVHYDPNEITYRELVEIFFATHDPTTLNRQGPDVGKQYRSVVFFHTDDQKRIVEQYVKQLTDTGEFKNPIVTQIVPFETFYPAEEYHQDYYRRNPNDPYVVSVTRPKVKKFEKQFAAKLKPSYIN
jgi:peptide-methionine (S)-S-oxide reductase